MGHSVVKMLYIDLVVITAASNGKPSLARMLVIATKGDLAAGDPRVGLGPISTFVPLLPEGQQERRVVGGVRHALHDPGPPHLPPACR